MKSFLPILAFFIILLPTALIGKDATALRVWTSKKGTTVVARAAGLVDGKVTLIKRGGKEVTLPLTELTVEDQLLIKDSFDDVVPERNEDDPDPDPINLDDPDLEGAEGEQLKDLPEEFERGLGIFQGPIRASEGSSYYIYLPTTMVEGEKAPLVFWTGHHEGKNTTLEWMREGAEITGTVLAVSVEAKSDDETTHIKNLEHTKDCLKHISMKLPVETKWVFFAGNDRGGASAFFNSDRFRCAGAFVVNGYIPKKTVANGRGYYFISPGTQNTNRYLSAKAVNEIGRYATFFPYDGNVRLPTEEVGTHGLIWLYTRHLYSMSRLRSSEARRFEKRFSEWLKDYADTSPWETMYYCRHLLITCDVGGEFRDFVLKVQAEVEKEPMSKKYMDARKALARFAEKTYAGYGSLDVRLDKNHTSPKIVVEVDKLVEDYGDVPDLGRLFSKLSLPTID